MIKLQNLPSLADRLVYIRRVKGLTQAELASLAGTSQQAIQQAEKGLARHPRYLPRLAQALGLPAEWLSLNEMPAGTNQKTGLSDKDDTVLGAFKAMSKKDQEFILEIMKTRAKQ